MYARCEDQPRFFNEDIIALGILQFYIICWLTNEYSKVYFDEWKGMYDSLHTENELRNMIHVFKICKETYHTLMCLKTFN